MHLGKGSRIRVPKLSISRPPPTAILKLSCKREFNFHDVAFWIDLGSHFGTIWEPGWPLKLTLGRSGLNLAPFKWSSSRPKSVSAKTEFWKPFWSCGASSRRQKVGHYS